MTMQNFHPPQNEVVLNFTYVEDNHAATGDASGCRQSFCLELSIVLKYAFKMILSNRGITNTKIQYRKVFLYKNSFKMCLKSVK